MASTISVMPLISPRKPTGSHPPTNPPANGGDKNDHRTSLRPMDARAEPYFERRMFHGRRRSRMPEKHAVIVLQMTNRILRQK